MVQELSSIEFTVSIWPSLADRGGAIILRVGDTNITASEASQKIEGCTPHMTFWGYNSCKETYGEPIGQRYLEICLL